MPADIRIFVESASIPETEVFPVIKGLFDYKKESKKAYYTHEAKDKFKFKTPADYALLKPLFANECEEVTLTVKRKCGSDYVVYWIGFFKMFNAYDNRDKCFIEVKIKPYDAYKCFNENLETVQNVYTSGAIVTTSAIGGTIETETCTDINSHATCSDYYEAYYTPLEDCVDNSEWCLKENQIKVNGSEGEPTDCSSEFVLEQNTTWHREVFETDCEAGVPVEPTFGSDWNLLEDNCGTTNTAKWWRCPSSGGSILGPYTRGRLFKNIVEKVVQNLGCALTVKSDFFGINPVGDAPSNIAYDFATAYCQNISFHQKSDIKLKSVLTPSSSPAWDLSAKDFFEDMEKIFNVQYRIVGSTLILEHVSFFTSDMGLIIGPEVDMPKGLEYGTPENLKSEQYYWPESSSYEFKANPILYDCGEKAEERRCTILSTDIGYIEDTYNADRVADSGFVIISNGLNGSDLVINDNNSPFKWSNLQNALHKHARAYKSGKINGVSQTFLSWEPYIKQDKFKITGCCENPFNPAELITTSLGIASVGAAEENIYFNKIELELIY